MQGIPSNTIASVDGIRLEVEPVPLEGALARAYDELLAVNPPP